MRKTQNLKMKNGTISRTIEALSKLNPVTKSSVWERFNPSQEQYETNEFNEYFVFFIDVFLSEVNKAYFWNKTIGNFRKILSNLTF